MKTIAIAAIIALAAFAGCSSQLKDTKDLPTSPALQGVHPAGFAIPSSNDFHGTLLISTGFDYSSCRKCHGPQLDGGVAKQSCADARCHATIPGDHPTGFTNVSSPDFHGTFLLSTGYDMTPCGRCHGANLDGGAANRSCSSTGCHVLADGGPKACYTCHGDAQTKKPYPTVNTFHATHLEGGTLSSMVVACAGCHTVPSTITDPGHYGGANPNGAEVNITDALAAVQTKGTTGTPTHNTATHSCANTYCHGNFTNGNNASPVWNGVDQAKCGTCHGDPSTGSALPKAPHPAVATCSVCHIGVVDASGAIIDKAKHVNGKLNVFNAERMPGTEW